MAGYIRMPLGTEVELGRGDIVLDAAQLHPKWGMAVKFGMATKIFNPCLLWPNGCPSQLLLSSCSKLKMAAAIIFEKR